MKINLRFYLGKLLFIAVCFVNISCITMWNRESQLRFDTSDLPEQEKTNRYAHGMTSAYQGRIKLVDIPLIYLSKNYCSKTELLSFAPSVLIYLPPIIPMFGLNTSGNFKGSKLRLYLSVVEEESDYDFDPTKVSLMLPPRLTLKPEKTESKSEDEVDKSTFIVTRKKAVTYSLYFDVNCADLEKGSLLIEGLRYKGEQMNLKPIPFQRDTISFLEWWLFGEI